jgi:hypothetical protein
VFLETVLFAVDRLPFFQNGTLSICLLSWLTGCSADTSQIQEMVRQATPMHAPEGVPTSGELDGEFSVDSNNAKESKLRQFVSLVDLPSPGRINAFELAGEFLTEKSDSTVTDKKREIFVLGFVEVDHMSVMLSVDGKTEILKIGDTNSGISVLEISPPQVRLSMDGVSWYASLFDRRKQ